MSRIPTKVAYISRSQYITEVIMRANTTRENIEIALAMASPFLLMFAYWLRWVA